MNTNSTAIPLARGERALVLGGGGSTGNAWLIGVLAGLADAGLDVTTADLTVGTSAGSTAAAQTAGAPPTRLYDDILDAPAPDVRRPAGRAPSGQVTDHLDRMNAIIAASSGPADFRRRIAETALDLEAASDGSASARWRAIVATRLPSPDWPERDMLITALDARTGEPVVFDRRSGVALVDAVAASCSNGFGVPPYRIGGGRYLDGGYRSNAENADLATGYERVLVLSPFGGRSLHPVEWGTHLAAQVDALRAGGSRVETIVPDPESEHLFGANAMNAGARPAAARAGHERGARLAERIAELWS